MDRPAGYGKSGVVFVLVALILPLLGACAPGGDPELEADEQNMAARRDKLASDEQSGNSAMIADDQHALFLARQKLLQDRGEPTQDEKRIEGGHGDHGGGHM